jgi:hypothetical protein
VIKNPLITKKICTPLIPVSKKGEKNILQDSFFQRLKQGAKLCDQKTKKKAINLKLSSLGK